MSIPELHDYQKVGVSFLKHQDRAGLFLDMGLGKTCITLSTLEERHLPVLVVAPKRVRDEVWPEEVATWRPDLSIALASGSPAQRQKALTSSADIVVIGRDVLQDAVPHALRFKTFVMDELSSFKNKKAIRWRAAHRIAKVVPHVWGLTGTPSPNGLMDLWPQMFLLDEGKRLGRTLTIYRQRFFFVAKQMPSGIVTEWGLQEGAEQRIHSLIDDIALSMQSEGRIHLPEFTLNKVKVHLPPAAKKIYERLERDLVVDLDLLGGEIHTAKNAAVLSAKLSQVTAGFLYHDDLDIRDNPTSHDWVHNTKMDALDEIIEGTDSPLLVFYRFKAERDRILAKYPQAETTDTPDVQARWNAGKIPLLLAHPASAGHGLNLQKGPGHTMVWTTLPWSLEEWDQANKRLHRQGQKNPVVCHVLHTPNTVDQVVWSRLVEKKSVQQALMDYLESVI